MIVGKNHRKKVEQRKRDVRKSRAWRKWGAARVLDVAMRYLRTEHGCIVSQTFVYGPLYETTGVEKVRTHVTIPSGGRYTVTIEKVLPDEEYRQRGF